MRLHKSVEKTSSVPVRHIALKQSKRNSKIDELIKREKQERDRLRDEERDNKQRPSNPDEPKK